jgi:hypothetical protein
MKSFVYYSRFYVLFLLITQNVIAQKSLQFIKQIQHPKELTHLYDSLLMPLLVDQQNVFMISSECFGRNNAGTINARNSGGTSNDRQAGGDANDRKDGGTANDRKNDGLANTRNEEGTANNRNQGGQANDRNGGGTTNQRNEGGSSNERNSAGTANDRTNGGSIAYYSCGRDSDGILIIYFHNKALDSNVKIYYNHLFYNKKSKFFKIKKYV